MKARCDFIVTYAGKLSNVCESCCRKLPTVQVMFVLVLIGLRPVHVDVNAVSVGPIRA